MRPNQVLLFIIAVMVSLGILCVVLPGRVVWGGYELRWPTLTRVLGTEQPDRQDTTALAALEELEEFPVFTDTIVPADTVAEGEPLPAVPKVPVDSTTDSRLFLHSFYTSLPAAQTRVVRVVHYGDSQIEEDRMTQQIREMLQNRYGGKGVGLLPLVQTIPTVTTRQELRMNGRNVTPMQGPRRYLVYGPKHDQRKDGLYGPMGQSAWMADSLVRGSEAVDAVAVPQTDGSHYELWKVFADSSVHYTCSGDTVHLRGKGAVYGMSQESGTGIIVDNIPMRGCLGLVFTHVDSAQLGTFYRDENVRLIIMQYGGNAIPFNKKAGTIQSIVYGLRDQVRYIRACAPQTSILFIGPSDMLTLSNGEWVTYPMVPYMDGLLRKMALEENIAYFSLYRWMGGAGSMLRWKELGLAGEDGVHFTRAGARKAGKAVAEWLLEGTEN